MVRARWLVGIGLLSVFLIAAVMYLSQAQDSKPVKRISLQPSSAEVISPPRQKDTLKIAVGAIISPTKSLVFYEDIFDYIGEKLGREVEMVQRKTYAEVNFLMKEGLIDAAFVCSRPYVEGHRDFGMELLCVPMCFGKTEYCSYFIVHKDSPIQNLEELRGKVFAFSDPLSNTGRLTVGVALVRQLNGVLHAEQATAGILATTSFFTSGAQQFQKTVAFQISLKDYFGIQGWLNAVLKK